MTRHPITTTTTGSRAWSLYFRAQYRLLRVVDPILRWWWHRSLPGLGPIVDLHIPGRRTGRRYRTLLTLLAIDDRWYVGHPNGDAGWTRNLAAAGRATLVASDGSTRDVAPIRLYGGPEREAVIRATWSQHPLPGNLVYALARRHVRATGVYLRLVPREPPSA
ncbi:MAG TPA: hypothetical protein VH813_02220 [Candidatus Limnocylindrales bacterium]|jgi:hypothetical protein